MQNGFKGAPLAPWRFDEDPAQIRPEQVFGV
jgi:hypothetical protein